MEDQATYHTKGKIPPQAIDFEQAVLGAMLIDNSAIHTVVGLLNSESFYREEHQVIFKTIKDLFGNGKPVDLLTVTNELRTTGLLEAAAGDYYLVELSQKVSSSAHSEFHARIIMQKHIQREVIRVASNVINQAFDETTDVFELLDNAYSGLNTISETVVQSEEKKLSELIPEQIEKAVKISKGEIKPGIPTPIYNLTYKTGGWRNGELIILAGRPGMGKTAFAIQCGLHAARLSHSTAFFSLEMSEEQITNRIISSEGGIEGDKFTIHGLNTQDVMLAEQVKRNLEQTPFYIDASPMLTIQSFQAKAQRITNKYGIKLIIVDYLQLMSSSDKKGNREQEISTISRGLKLVAKKLNIPIIALSQLSRLVEQRGGSKRPMLSDVRESGAIEQDADMVSFIYRPEYYDIEYWDDYGGVPTAGEAEYFIAKNRNGGLTRNRMKFEKHYARFGELE